MLDALIDALIAANLATEGAAFKAYQPPDPIKALILRRYGGGQPAEDFDHNVVETPAVQFMFRAATYDEAEAWAQQVFAWCYGAVAVLGPNHILAVTPRGPVLDAGQDDNHNALVTLNVDVARNSIVRGAVV